MKQGTLRASTLQEIQMEKTLELGRYLEEESRSQGPDGHILEGSFHR